jgi:hypothetical protein
VNSSTSLIAHIFITHTLVAPMFLANFFTSEPFFKCETLHYARTSMCNPLLSVLLWTLMIQSTSLVYRGTLRLVVSQGFFPPIGPWTYTTTDTSLVSRDMKGPSLWGPSPLGGSGGQRCPEPFYIHHCSPFSSGVAVSQHCAQFILLTGSTYRFRSFISSFCPPHLSL